MFCTNCGSPLGESASYCSNCGAPRWGGDVNDPYSDAGLAARGYKLCVSCGSEILRDARICDRCDAHQPTEVSARIPLPAPDLVASTPDFSSVLVEQTSPRIASIPRRIAAFGIDFVVLFFAILIFAFAYEDNTLLLISAVLAVGYPFVAEGAFGHTIGKWAVGIEVVADDFGRLTWGKSAGRNLLRIIDQLPALYLVGLLVMGVSDRNQRVGDRAARTLVVHREDT